MERLYSAVKQVLEDRGMPVVDEWRTQEGLYVIAGQDENEFQWGRIEKLVAKISGNAQRSKLFFILPAYQLTYHERSVLRSLPKMAMGAAPWDRKTAFVRASEFLGSVHDKAIIP